MNRIREWLKNLLGGGVQLADTVEGRIIHYTVDVTLHPPAVLALGDTDVAWDIGDGMSAEIAEIARQQGESAGFTVEIEKRQVVY
jgi:hypothetical protein